MLNRLTFKGVFYPLGTYEVVRNTHKLKKVKIKNDYTACNQIDDTRPLTISELVFIQGASVACSPILVPLHVLQDVINATIDDDGQVDNILYPYSSCIWDILIQ